MTVYFDLGDVDTFTTGAVGRPGQRTFFLQARGDGRRVSIKCEKQQAAAIAQYLRRILSDLPPAADRPLPSSLELALPIEAAFTLGPIGLGYDPQADRIVLQLDELVPADLADEDDDELEPERGRVRLHLSRGQALAFCEQAEAVVAAGRPSCIFCGNPIDPEGHPCPRMN
jgi:uncharacterized repeat protein (TIGR03847 family)